MSDQEPPRKDDAPENPFEQVHKQLQEMFRKANITVLPFTGGMPSPVEDGEGGDGGEEEPEAGGERRRVLEEIRSFRMRPRDIKEHLDRYVIRQDEAKRAMAVAVCDHYNHVRRCLEDPRQAQKAYQKQNVLLLGPTGVGKTHLLRTLARLVGVPFVKADATKFSETGYVGHDVEDMVRDLVRAADGDVELASYGIIHIDEVDKIAASAGVGKDVSGRGVQTNLLKLMEETEVPLLSQTDMMGQMREMMRMQRGGKESPRTISTRHILFIASGAFSNLAELVRRRMHTHAIGFGSAAGDERGESAFLAQAGTQDFVAFGFEPEFIGRLPVRVAFDPLGEEDLLHILEQAEDNILSKYLLDFEGYGIRLRLEPEALREVARRAAQEKTGARGLMTVFEAVFRDFKFELPSSSLRELTMTRGMLDDPAGTVARLVEAHPAEADTRRLGEVEDFARRFSEEHGVAFTFSVEAAAEVARRAEAEGCGVQAVCARLFKDYPYGVNLILRDGGERVWTVTAEMVRDPDGELSRRVVEHYREGEGG